jgi:hypothetical protein
MISAFGVEHTISKVGPRAALKAKKGFHSYKAGLIQAGKHPGNKKRVGQIRVADDGWRLDYDFKAGKMSRKKKTETGLVPQIYRGDMPMHRGGDL